MFPPDPQPSPCPADEELLALLVPEPDPTPALSSHLDDCAACRERLETLAGAETVDPLMRDFEEWADLGREITRILEPARANGLSGVGAIATEATRPEALSALLDPPGEPGSLGHLGGLDILEIIGEGGMGLVLRARDARLEREVAVKLLKPALRGAPGLARRFFEEARAVAALSHEHIVPIHQVAEQNGLPYLVMPLARGSTLENILANEGPPPFPDALDLCLRITAGLAAAHAAGLVHRDVKPDNVLIESREAAPFATVWLADFGLARRTGEGIDPADPTATAGTPGYRAPEVTTGAEPDQRADLYALGALFHTLAPDGAPPWFRQLVDRLRADSPADRPGSAADVLRELEVGQESLRAAAWSRRANREWLRVAGWATASLLTVGGLIFSLDLSGRTRMVNASLEAVADAHIEIQGRFGVFTDLAAAVAAAEDGDTIVLHGPGPFPTRTIPSKGTSLTIAGANPETPARIELDALAKANQPALWWTGGATLRLRDVEIHHEPPANQAQFTEPVPPLIRIEGGSLEITRCTLRRVPVYGEMQPIVIQADHTARITLGNCLLHNTNATLVAWSSRGDPVAARIELENCLISGGRLLTANGNPDASGSSRLSLTLRHCRANLDTAFAFPRDPDRLGVEIDLESCDVQTRGAFFVTADGRPGSLPSPANLRVSGGSFAHLGNPPVGVPGLDFPAIGPPGQPPPVWLRQPIFVERKWLLIGDSK